MCGMIIIDINNNLIRRLFQEASTDSLRGRLELDQF